MNSGRSLAFVIAAVLFAALVTTVAQQNANAESCGRLSQWSKSCPGSSLKDGRAELTVNDSESSRVNGRKSPSPSDLLRSNTSTQSDPIGVLSPEPDDNCDFRCDDWSVTLLPDEDDVDDAPAVVVTIADVARFRPAIGGDHMEPNGWAVIGLPANFYARGGVSVKRGELFERPALVRFTPVAWTWDYGDGSSRSTVQPGASWAALGADEFDDTATSHVFDEPGDFRIQLTISYSAEYQFAGSGWIPIDGLLPVASNPIEARAVTARTVLVSQDCNNNPGGPGC